MRALLILLVHLITTTARLLGPGGARSVIAESLLVKHQLLILNRSRQRAPNLRASDRLLAGVCSLFIRPTRVVRSAIVRKPSTILDFHRHVRTRKYRLRCSPTRRGRPGPQGSVPRVGGRHCRNEEAKSEMGVSAECAADRPGLRGPDRQGRRAACARHARSTGIELDRPVMADVLGACDRPPVEHRTCSAASQPGCAAMGCWWSWTSTRDGSSASVSTPALWMARPWAACATMPFARIGRRNTSAPTTIPCTGSTSGPPTGACDT